MPVQLAPRRASEPPETEGARFGTGPGVRKGDSLHGVGVRSGRERALALGTVLAAGRLRTLCPFVESDHSESRGGSVEGVRGRVKEVRMRGNTGERAGTPPIESEEESPRTCAWCGDQAVDPGTEIPPTARISHVICALCLQDQLEALRLPVPEAA